jgi:ribosomal protein S18 acetylase RimI-like enzyme
LDTVVFTILTEDNIEEVLHISNQLFGQDYYTAATLNQLNQKSIIRVAQVKDEVVGFFIFRIFTRAEANFLDSTSDELILKVKTIGVKRSYQRKGLATQIFAQVPHYIKEMNIKDAYCVAWDNAGIVSMHQIHMKAGFSVWKRIENYWKEESIEYNYSCPTCGNPCLCSAVIYHKNYQ